MALKGYGGYKADAMTREKEELDRVFGAAIIKLKVGRNIIRLLPPKEGQDTPFRMVWMHFVPVAGNDKPEVFPCPRKEANKPCPVCAKAEELRSSGDDALFEKAKTLFARRQWYANAIDRKTPTEVKLLAAGKEIQTQINAIARNLMEEDRIDITDPYEGIDLVVERSGTGREDTEYTVTQRGAKLTALGEDDEAMQALIDAMVDLEAKAKPPTSEEIMQRLRGGGSQNRTRAVSEGSKKDGKQRSLPKTAEDDIDHEPPPPTDDDFIDTDAYDEDDSDSAVDW